MKRINVLVGVALTLMALAGCGAKPENVQKEKAKKVHPVKIKKLEKQRIAKTVKYTANIEAYEKLDFAPASPGRINRVYVEEGNRVRKGDLLVDMDKTQLIQALSQLETARSNFLRSDTLYQSESISEQQYDQAKSQYEVVKANVEFLKKNTTLKAPFSGIVTHIYYEAGEMYNAAPNTMEGKSAVLTLMQLHPVKLNINVSERYYPQIKEGTKANVYLDIYPDEVFEAVLSRVYPTVDPSTRTFMSELVIQNRDEKLRPGMFARLELELDEMNSFVVPAITVLQQSGTNKRFVFVNEGGEARKIMVTIGQRMDDKIEVISDEISEGVQLIVSGQANLTDGAEIKIIN